MFYYVSNFLLVLLEISSCTLFLEIFLNKAEADKPKNKIPIIISVSLLMYLIAFLFANMMLVKMILIIIAMSLVYKLYFKCKFIKSVAFVILYQSIILVIDFLVYAVIYSFFQNEELIEAQYETQSLMLVVLGKLILFIVVLIIKKIFDKKSTHLLSNKEWLQLICFPVFTCIIISALIWLIPEVESTTQSKILFITSIGMVSLNIMVFYLINEIITRENIIHTKNLNALKIKNELDFYYTLSDNYANQRKKEHEFKNQLMCINALINNEEYDEAKNYINKISKNVSSNLHTINTGNTVLNAVLNTKYQEALDKNILFTLNISDMTKLPLEVEDIVVLISNLLNNAIEAAELCEEKRQIQFKMHSDNNELYISAKNTYNHTLIIKDNIYESTKTDPKERGYGMKNIIDIVNKYNGNYCITPTENEFLIMIKITY